MASKTPPATGTKTRDVLDVFDDGETMTSAEVANAVDWVPVENDASAVSPQLRTLTERGFLDREPSAPYSKFTRVEEADRDGGCDGE